MTERFRLHGGLAALALLAGCIVLVWPVVRPPVGLCDGPIGLAHVAFGLAQGLSLAGFVALRRAGQSGAPLAIVGVAWALACGLAAASRACAGVIRLASAGDIAFAALAGAALAMLCGGLSERARSRAQGLALAAIVVAAGIAAAWLADGRSRDRIWRTWAVMVAIGDALDMTRAANGHLPPAVGIPVADIEAALPEAVRGGLTFVDAWGQPILYTQRDGAWRLESLGLDARPGPYSDGPSRDFADDLVIRDGSPVAWPESPCAGGPRAPPSDPGLVDTRGRHGH